MVNCSKSNQTFIRSRELTEVKIMKYFIIEHQKRTDGVINTSETARGTFASALSYYHERYSKMVVNTEFKSVSIMLVDENLDVIQKDTIQTLYEEIQN